MEGFAHTARLPLLLRSERMLQDDIGVFERVAGAWLMLTPNNPSYWWGNTLFMDQPPALGDVARWSALFEKTVQRRQPTSMHMTFGWEGVEPGLTEPFIDAGFSFFELVALQATSVAHSPAPPAGIELRALGQHEWVQLIDFMVEGRQPGHSETTYRPFIAASIENWKRLARLDRGHGYGAFCQGQLVAALGLFVEAAADGQGRRLARFQQVLVAAQWRCQGIAAALLALAAHDVGLRHAPTDLVIQADAKGSARRIYERLGFKAVGSSFGLERAPMAAPDPV